MISTAVSSEILTAGIDVGTSSVKAAIIRMNAGGWKRDDVEVLALRAERIRRRDLKQVINESFHTVLEDAGVSEKDLAYVASTGEGELVHFRRGHFFGMTTHARGAVYMLPGSRAVLDVGALHGRAMRIDGRSKVLSYRMTTQCASGSGQFLENVARYLGVALEEVGPLSKEAKEPEMVSSICAVLAETDVINMVSRGISTSDILKGIHLSMAGRYIKLLRAIGATECDVAVTGGLAADEGLIQAMRELIQKDGIPMLIQEDPQSIHAGAIGAALWGGYRHEVLERKRQSA